MLLTWHPSKKPQVDYSFSDSTLNVSHWPLKDIEYSGDHVNNLSPQFYRSNQKRHGLWKGGVEKARTALRPAVPPVIFIFLGDMSARCVGQVREGWPWSNCLTGTRLREPEEWKGGIQVCQCADASAVYFPGWSDRKIKHSKCFPTVPQSLVVACQSLEKGIQYTEGQQHQAALCTLAPWLHCEVDRRGQGRQMAFMIAEGRFPKVD